MSHLRVVVLGIVPHLFVPPSSITHRMQNIPLVNRGQLTLTRRAIIMYLLVALICTYIRPNLDLVIEEGSHHS